MLKALSNRWAWVGEVVHNMVELALQGLTRGEEVDLEALIERGTRTMRANYAESVQKVYRERPMSACGLVEHEYDEPIARDDWRERRDHMEKCLRNFYGLELTQTIRQTPHWRWLALERQGSFEIDGAVAVVRPDFAWRDPEGHVAVVDWKTGMARPQHEDLQLAIYGAYAQRAWGLQADHMDTYVAYLGSGEVRRKRVERSTLSEVETKIAESIRTMRALGNTADKHPPIERFPMTDDQEKCATCAFRRICKR